MAHSSQNVMQFQPSVEHEHVSMLPQFSEKQKRDGNIVCKLQATSCIQDRQWTSRVLIPLALLDTANC